MTKDWVNNKSPKALLIGHDPRLQKSESIAEYAFFADYYFNIEPNRQSEKRKYGLAKSVFEHLHYSTNGKIKPGDVYLTNLCNDALGRAPEGKTVLIPEHKAYMGVQRIIGIIRRYSTIEYVFPMSMQVNYWLQKFDFYKSGNNFEKCAEPKEKGLSNKPPYYEPKRSGCFQTICGNIYYTKEGNKKLIPLLHPKNYPLSNKFKVYQKNYDRLREEFVK